MEKKVFDSTLATFLPVAVVERELEKRGSKITKVSFVKADNTGTTRTGLPKVKARRVGGDKGPEATPESEKRAQASAKGLARAGNVMFDYTDATQGAFSFNKGRVVAIGDVGTHPA